MLSKLSLLNAAALLASSFSPAQASAAHGAHHHARSNVHDIAARASHMPNGWSLQSACVTDVADSRLLTQNTNFETTLTPAVCTRQCASGGFVYAGLQDGHECWCGSTLNTKGGAGASTDASSCSMPCAGNSTLTCGGFYAVSLYSNLNSSNIYQSWSSKLRHSSTVLPTTTGSSVHATTSKAAVVSSSTSKAATSAATTKASTSPAATTKAATTSKASTSPAATTKTATSSSPASSSTSKYKLVENMEGSSFFSHFDFFTAADPTGGSVDYVSSSVANSSGLISITDGQAIMKVDSTTYLASGASRKSVRVSSKNSYATGLMIFDVAAMPYGCSVWPAMWTVGSNWPQNGEIDIIEGVNNATVNQLTLHTGTSTSCDTTAVPSTAVSTSFMSKTCASSATADAGCGYQDTSASAYGRGFNAAGGAVFALLIDADAGVTIWKFVRGSVPSDVTSGSPNPSAWGTPQASWPATSSCKTTDVIGAQAIVFDITLCGGWCASDYPSSGCPGSCTDQLADPTNYLDAVWKINSVKVYQ